MCICQPFPVHWIFTSEQSKTFLVFFGVVNTYPLDNFNNKKTVTLIVIDDIYQPVVAKQVDAELAPVPAVPALQSEYPVIVISDCESEVVVEYSQKVDPSPVFGV